MFSIDDINATKEQVPYGKELHKIISGLDQGRTYKIKLTPEHNGNVGDSTIFYVDLKPFPPTLEAGDIGKETEFKVHVHTNISNCESVHISTEPELQINPADSISCRDKTRTSWEFKNLQPGTFVNVSAVVIQNSLQSDSAYLAVATKPGTPKLLEQNFNEATNETLLKLFLPGYGRVLEICLTHTTGTENCYEEGFQKTVRLLLGRDTYQAVIKVAIIGFDDQSGDSLSFVVGVAILKDVQFYEQDTDYNLYLQYTEIGPLSTVNVKSTGQHTGYTCNHFEKPCTIENIDHRGIRESYTVTPIHDGVDQILTTEHNKALKTEGT